MSVQGAERGAGATGSSDSEERRGKCGQRVQFEALVAVGEAAGAGFEAESVDVSPAGMRLRTAYLPEVGERLVCRFDGMSSEIVVDGEVLWCKEEGRGGEFGLRFLDLDERSAEAVRSMCATLGGESSAPQEQGATARGTRVRLHIDGLGSPMKARVRDATSGEIMVGSNLEFLRVGRPLEIEDVEQGIKREATIDHVKVEIDPASNVPQLVVALRYEGAQAKERDGGSSRVHTLPFGLRSLAGRAAAAAAATRSNASGDSTPDPVVSSSRSTDGEDEAEGSASSSRSGSFAERPTVPTSTDAEDEAAAERFLGTGAKATRAGIAMAKKVGPALSGATMRAKGAALLMLASIQKRRADQAEAKKAKAPRRMTAPPPGGALKSEGRRLVRDDGADLEEEAAPARINKRAAAIGGALGVVVVLAILGFTRFGAPRQRTAANGDGARSPVAAQAPAMEPAPASPGTPTANVPLFGATPLSTTEPAPGAPSPMAAGPNGAGDPGASSADDGDEEPSIDDEVGEGKEFGNGEPVKNPVVLKIKMDGTIEKIAGASGAIGFTLRVPDRKSVAPASDFGRKDKRIQSVHVVNKAGGAEITLKFKENVPPFLAKAKGDRLEIALGRSDGKKVAKAHDKGAKKKTSGSAEAKPKKGSKK